MICYKCTLIFHDKYCYETHLRSHEGQTHIKRKTIESNDLENIKKIKSTEDSDGDNSLYFAFNIYF